jgi:hypothetical protein
VADDTPNQDVPLRDHIAMLRRGDLQIVWVLGAGLLGFGAFAWAEIQRRLEILNHENARLLAQQERTVSRDTYDANEEQRKAEAVNLNDWRKDVDTDRSRSVYRDEFRADSRLDRRSKIDTNARVLSLLAAVAVAIIALLAYIAASHATPPTPSSPTVTITTTR